MITCSLCEIDLTNSNNIKRRLRNSKSGLLFCSKEHKNEALRLAVSGDKRYIGLIPNHYSLDKKDSKQCPGCLNYFKPNRTKQTYCSSSCVAKLQSRNKLERWLAGEWDLAQSIDGSILGWARRYLLEQVLYACSKCRWSESSANGRIPLEIDHIDGNWKNSHPDNLRILCPNCHSLTANYKIYNAGSNQMSRYNFYKEKNWW